MIDLDLILLSLIVTALLLANTLGVILVAIQLPGTWLILLATALTAWWSWESWHTGLVGGNALIILLALAILGELVEFFASAAGAKKAGASKRASTLAIIGGVLGGIFGMLFLWFLPIIGALVGAALGAALFSIAGDLWAGRQWEPALTGGRGAFFGKFWGALGKLGIAVLMWFVAVVALIWP